MAAFRRVAAYAPPGAVGLGLGLTSAIFRSRPGLTAFEFDFCVARPGPLATDLGVPVLVEHGPELLAASDLILLLPGASFAEPPPGPVLSALRAARERGATLAAHCLGVFRARRDRAARRPGSHHALAVRRPARGPLSAGTGPPGGPLPRPGRHRHRRRRGGGDRHVPAPDPPRARGGAGQLDRAHPGHPAAPGRRAAAVHHRAAGGGDDGDRLRA